MSAADVSFAGSIPALYEQNLGPLLFQPYAQEMAERIRGLGVGRVLETAAGTGFVTRTMAGVLPSGAEIVATDLNQAMLDLAATKLQAPNVTWQRLDAQKLPFEDASFDAVVCQFGVMFFPDKQAAYREALRVLQPEGRLLFTVWGPLSDNPLSQVVSEAVAKLFPQDPPRFFERTPFGYADPDRIRGEVQQAGFENVEVETVDKVSHAPSVEGAALGLCQGTPLRNEIEARAPERLEDITSRAAEALSAHFGPAPIENRMRAFLVTARR